MFGEHLSKEPYEHCLKHLKEEIEVAKPRLLLCMSSIGWVALK
ncbi:MAG: hypothetical protein KatS3mg003_2155 [Candidatus Nitrosocaldaceae archaeon]|nr:MAG: hypothetical protein KatS3mg003_2155 [Candidatus Nitrosocaldaceae archaeon]